MTFDDHPAVDRQNGACGPAPHAVADPSGTVALYRLHLGISPPYCRRAAGVVPLLSDKP